MKIGILGTGNIGKTLARTLAEAGHKVKVANSRGPDSITADILATGAQAATAEDALLDVDVAILSLPPQSLAKVRHLIATLPETTVLIDTSNYYPHRDGHIPALDEGQVEGEWASEQLGRRLVKAWNAITSDSFARLGRPAGRPDRIAIPVAGDRQEDRDLAMALVDDTGFDGYDAGTLAESWRQQPGAPVYCTDLGRDAMGAALASAERHRLVKRRDLAVAAVLDRMDEIRADPSSGFLVRLNRALYM